MDALICRDYIEHFFPRLHLLYQNAVHWDVIVKTKSRIFYAHRIVLAVASEVLANMLQACEKTAEAFVLYFDIPDDMIAVALEFIYSGKLIVTNDTIQAVAHLFAAWKLLSGLELCLQYISSYKVPSLSQHINPGTCDDIMNKNATAYSTTTAAPSDELGSVTVIQTGQQSSDSTLYQVQERAIPHTKCQLHERAIPQQKCHVPANSHTAEIHHISRKHARAIRRLSASGVQLSCRTRIRSVGAKQRLPASLRLNSANHSANPVLLPSSYQYSWKYTRNYYAYQQKMRKYRHRSVNDGQHYIKTTRQQFRCKTCKRVFLHKTNHSKHTASCQQHSKFVACTAAPKAAVAAAAVATTAATEVTMDRSFMSQGCLAAIAAEARPPVHIIAQSTPRDVSSNTLRENTTVVKSKSVRCDECGKSFCRNSTLQRHIRVVHKQIRPFVCKVCSVARGTAAELRAHQVLHEATKRFQCDMCEFATPTRSNLKSHLFHRHGGVKIDARMRIFRCHVCSYETDAKTRLTDHVRVHEKRRDIACGLCDKFFMTNKARRSHYVKVHKEKTFTCRTCAYATSERSKLREHERVMHTHRDVKPYRCSYCPFSSATSGNCRKHMSQKHSNLEVKVVKVSEDEAAAFNRTVRGVKKKRVGDKGMPTVTTSVTVVRDANTASGRYRAILPKLDVSEVGPIELAPAVPLYAPVTCSQTVTSPSQYYMAANLHESRNDLVNQLNHMSS